MQEPKITKPVIIIGCPRSGTSLLFRILSTSNELWSLYRESNDIWNSYYKLTGKDFKDETLEASDLDEKSRIFLLNEFHKHTINNYPIGYMIREYFLKKKPLNPLLNIITSVNLTYKNIFLNDYRIVEKTPKNCFRIPFIDKLFKNCTYIFLKRDGRANINSLIEGWKLPGKYVRGQAQDIKLNIKNYSENNGNYWKWKYVLPPGWENYTDKSLEEVCAFQWIASNKAAIQGLKNIEESRKYTISYEELSENTYETIEKVCKFINVPFSDELKKISQNPPLVNYVTKPKKDKWKKNIQMIEKTYSDIEPMI